MSSSDSDPDQLTAGNPFWKTMEHLSSPAENELTEQHDGQGKIQFDAHRATTPKKLSRADRAMMSSSDSDKLAVKVPLLNTAEQISHLAENRPLEEPDGCEKTLFDSGKTLTGAPRIVLSAEMTTSKSSGSNLYAPTLEVPFSETAKPVSYTHLTLPTIYSV